MLRRSFVPPEEIRDLRALTRLRAMLTGECSRHKQRVEKILEDALIKVSAVVSDLFGVSGRAMLTALLAASATRGCSPSRPVPRGARRRDRHFGIDRAEARLPEGRRLVLSTDFYTAYQSLARVDGVDPLWCWAHIRRYFIRAGDAHEQLRYWRDAWVARIADLYLARRAMAAAEVGSTEYTTAQAAFDNALAAIDLARRDQMRSPRPAPRREEGPGHPRPRMGRPGPPPRLPRPRPGQQHIRSATRGRT
jgi:hypothetical protein